MILIIIRGQKEARIAAGMVSIQKVNEQCSASQDEDDIHDSSVIQGAIQAVVKIDKRLTVELQRHSE